MTYAPLPHQPPGAPTPPHRRCDAVAASIRRIVVGLGVAALGTLNAYVVLLSSSFRCDESCSDAPTSWHENADAWQWPALGWLGAACFALCIAFAVTFAGRRPRAAVILFAGAFVAGVVPWLLLGV
jgi:hypothetical protein